MTRSSASPGSPAKMQVRSYLASLPPDARRHLRKVREIILAEAPGAVDSFSYGIPAFRLDGRPLVWYAAWKQHISLYPMSESVRKSLADKLRNHETSKGTVRFSLAKPLPVTLVRQLVRGRIAEVHHSRGAK